MALSTAVAALLYVAVDGLACTLRLAALARLRRGGQAVPRRAIANALLWLQIWCWPPSWRRLVHRDRHLRTGGAGRALVGREGPSVGAARRRG
ncbi:MAG: hypothetical protein U0802_24090 [Candidatus Binatia bacterium]